MQKELNKKLVEWAGLEDSLGLDRAPTLTESLDACFRHLVPKALRGIAKTFKIGYVEAHKTLFTWWLEELLKGNTTKPALALCLVIEKLIDGENK